MIKNTKFSLILIIQNIKLLDFMGLEKNDKKSLQRT